MTLQYPQSANEIHQIDMRNLFPDASFKSESKSVRTFQKPKNALVCVNVDKLFDSMFSTCLTPGSLLPYFYAYMRLRSRLISTSTMSHSLANLPSDWIQAQTHIMINQTITFTITAQYQWLFKDSIDRSISSVRKGTNQSALMTHQ